MAVYTVVLQACNFNILAPPSFRDNASQSDDIMVTESIKALIGSQMFCEKVASLFGKTQSHFLLWTNIEAELFCLSVVSDDSTRWELDEYFNLTKK